MTLDAHVQKKNPPQTNPPYFVSHHPEFLFGFQFVFEQAVRIFLVTTRHLLLDVVQQTYLATTLHPRLPFFGQFQSSLLAWLTIPDYQSLKQQTALS